jgi:hypothetical protein
MIRVPGLVVHVGAIPISAHFLFESLTYAVGFALYQRDRQRRGDLISTPNRSSVIVAAILGAAAGSKLLAWVEDPAWPTYGSLSMDIPRPSCTSRRIRSTP